MKDIQSTDDIKQIFDSVGLPPIDVSHIVMQRIYKRRNERDMPRGKKMIIGILLIALLILTVGFAAIKAWDLKGPSNIFYQYQLIDSGDTLPEDFYKAEFDFLEPGKALAIMKTKDNPKNAIHLLPKPIKIQNIDELSSKVGSSFKCPLVLPQGYAFGEGRLDYKFDDAHVEEMIKESKNTDKDYIIKVLKPGNEVSHYDIIYNNLDDTIIVSVFFNYPSKIIYDIKNDHKAVKINVNNFEAMYVEHDGIGEITWLEEQDNSTTYYSIRSLNIYENIKDDLINVSESLE